MRNAALQGIRGLFRNGWYTLVSILTVTICLFLSGILYTVLADLNATLSRAVRDVTVTVFFTAGTTEEKILDYRAVILDREEVRDVVYVSAEEAWETFGRAYLGEYASDFDDNPLSDCASLRITMGDIDRQRDLTAFLEKLPDVRKVNSSVGAARALESAGRVLTLALAGSGLSLALISLFLIYSTISAGIAARQKEIEILKYLGASDGFVYGPFFAEGLLIGLLGAGAAFFLVTILCGRAMLYLEEGFPVLTEIFVFLPMGRIWRTLGPAFFGFGCGIGLMGSLLPVGRHLKV